MARPKTATSSLSPRRSPCPVGCLLDIVGDRWTMLVIRDLFFGSSKFGDFLDSPECIPTNILANRLVRLEEAALISKTPYQTNPVRHAYTLTERGKTLAPVLESMAAWGLLHLPGTAKRKALK